MEVASQRASALSCARRSARSRSPTSAFADLDAQEVTSSAWVDNAASLAVSVKVGYQENGQRRQVRRSGELATMQHLVLTPSRLVRHHFDLEVQGLGAVREFLGIEQPSTSRSNGAR